MDLSLIHWIYAQRSIPCLQVQRVRGRQTCLSLVCSSRFACL
jgi:hypothetical protein